MKIDRETLIQRRDRVLRWVRSEYGFIFCYDNSEWERFEAGLKELVVAVPDVFEAALQLGLCAFFVYRQSEQAEEFTNDDGQCFKDVTCDGQGTLYAVGISSETISQGPEYLTLVLLHEINHITHGGEHSQAFHDGLDDLLRRYNERTGRHIENDYCGLTD